MKSSMRNYFIIFAFFFIPIQVQANYLIPMGHAIGIELQFGTVYVTQDTKLESGEQVKKGEQIIALNGEPIEKIAPLENIQSEKIDITLQNKNKKRQLAVSQQDLTTILPHLKDTTDGNGTLTYIDPETNEFGALGHQIIDASLQQELPFKKGSIFLASITQVKKSTKGQPGYKISSFNKKYPLAKINSNELYGVFGNFEKIPGISLKQPMETIRIEEIKLGPAEMLTAIKGSEIQSFSINIEKIDEQVMYFSVDDEDLMKATGGIVQGMSGSPIVQNNYFVGAVTHMFVDNPTEGAAISILEMKKK